MEIPNYLEKTFEYLNTLPGIVLLVFFGFSNFLENVFPPWPGDTFTVFSGFLASKPQAPFSLPSLVFSTIVGNWVGALVMFYFGKRVLHYLRHSELRFIRNVYQEKAFQRTVDWFRKYSGLLIVFSRFSAGIRFFVAIVAGMSKMSAVLFLFYYSIAISIWCGLLLFSGFKLGENWDQINVMLTTYNQFISILLLLIFLIGTGFYFYKKKEPS